MNKPPEAQRKGQTWEHPPCEAHSLPGAPDLPALQSPDSRGENGSPRSSGQQALAALQATLHASYLAF